MAIYFAPIARLLGDLVVCLQPLQQLIESGEEVRLVVRSESQIGLAECVHGLAGYIKESEFLERLSTNESLDAFRRLLGEHQHGKGDDYAFTQDRAELVATGLNQDTLFNYREHPLQTDFVWGAPEFNAKYPGYRIAHVIEEISATFGVEYDRSLFRPLLCNPVPELKSSTILIPGTASPIKSWPTRSWIELYQILKARGEKCILIGEPAKNDQVQDLLDAGIPWMSTPSLSEAINILSSAARVVAVDTGLMHLAVHQGVNTIAMFRHNAFFARDYSHVQNLFADPCDNKCHAQEYSHKPNGCVFYSSWDNEQSNAFWADMRCLSTSGKKCMSSITVASVLKAIDRSVIRVGVSRAKSRKDRSRQDAGAPGIEPNLKERKVAKIEAGRMPALPGSNRT